MLITSILLLLSAVAVGIRAPGKTFIHKFLLGIDILVATLIWGRGDITISARAGLAHRAGKKWGTWLCRALDIIETNHCELAIEADRQRAQYALKELK